MGRFALDKIKETVPENMLTGLLQVSSYSCTKVREAIAAVLEDGPRAYSIMELVQTTHLPRMSIYRNLKILCKKRLAHHSPTLAEQ